ncbi:MAG: hypothetical protein V1816_05215 [Pseudomonadota bacterium]
MIADQKPGLFIRRRPGWGGPDDPTDLTWVMSVTATNENARRTSSCKPTDRKAKITIVDAEVIIFAEHGNLFTLPTRGPAAKASARAVGLDREGEVYIFD